MALTDELKDFGLEVGLDLIRVRSAEYLSSAAGRIKQRVQRGLWPEFSVNRIKAYCSPKIFLPSAKSVIVVAESYLTSEPIPMSRPGEPRAQLRDILGVTTTTT
jgi:epoxyqueuosine reductase QueG